MMTTENKWEHVTEVLRSELKNYLQKNKLQSVVLGESGGVDSALTSALVAEVCNDLHIPFIGRSIAIETNTPAEIERANAVGESFCSDFKFVDLTLLYRQVVMFMEEDYDSSDTSKAYRLRMGNIKARLRMIYLYNLAQKYQGMVLSTDNYTEWMLGFWTLHGDVGDYDLLFGLWKTEVYELARYVLSTLKEESQKKALLACIDCAPTDGLGITSCDVEQFGAKNYDEVDAALQAYVNCGLNEINPSVVARHQNSQFKRENPVFIKRNVYFKADVSEIRNK
jgi:NAD+ synthase